MKQKNRSTLLRSEVALHLIGRVPDTVRNALLADEGFVRQMELPVAKTIHFSNALSVDAERFAGALSKIAAGQSKSKVAVRDNKQVTFKGKLGKDGSITLSAKGVSIIEPDGAVLSPKKGLRINAGRRILSEALLPAQSDAHWRGIIAQRPLSPPEFLALRDDSLRTPEAFHERLRQAQRLSFDAMVPLDAAYFRALLPEPKVDEGFDAYLHGTLAHQRTHQVAVNVLLACARISVSAISQSLVPFDLLQSVRTAELEILLTREDPFSLLFVFDVAARRVPSDPHAIEIGSKALEKLFGDKELATERAALFSACAVLATVGLRRITSIRSAPLFWRRLLAFTHAGVLTNALFNNLNPATKFKDWVLDHFGASFFWTSVAERRLAPRWWPEWIDSDTLETELVGRALIAFRAVPKQHRPPQWVTIIDKLESDQTKNKTYAQMFFAGPVDDFQFTEGQHDPTKFDVTLEALQNGLPLYDVPGLVPFLHMARMSQQHVSLFSASLAKTVEPEKTDDIPKFVNALQAAAQAAAANRSAPLADAVGEKVLRVFQRADAPTQQKLVTIIIDAANAMLDEHQHLSWLSLRLERLAFLCSTTEQIDFVSGAIHWLSKVDPVYRPYLSRARAVADLFRLREAGVN